MLQMKAQLNKTLAQGKTSLVLFYCSGLVRVPPHRTKMSLPFNLISPYHFGGII